jgi:pimeloyl-ACP methyl ester carboxylesterase
MTDDLKQVIRVLRIKYGSDSEIFLVGHSFGGLLTSSFMTTGNNQSLIKGWIFVDGSHDYPLNDTLTRQMLLTVGEQQVALDKNSGDWKEIIDYCAGHPGPFTLEESDQLVDYAASAEDLMDEVSQVDMIAISALNAIRFNWPLTSMLINYLYTSGADLNSDLFTADFSGALHIVTTPTLVVCGQYDFVCPPDLEKDFYNRIGTKDKKMAVSPISGHNLMFQDESFFCNEISSFIETHK